MWRWFDTLGCAFVAVVLLSAPVWVGYGCARVRCEEPEWSGRWVCR